MTSTEYNVDGKLFKGIISMFANSLACVRVKGGESECFSIGSRPFDFSTFIWMQ